MRFLVLSAILLAGTQSFGQITLTDVDFADGGDTVRMSTTTDNAIDYSSTGANFTWDFSNLVPQTQVLRDYKSMNQASILVNFIFGNFAPPSYQATNFTASDAIPVAQISNFLPVNISEVNQVSKNSATEINSIGFVVNVEGTEVPFKSDTIETRYELPLNFGDVYTSRGYSNLDMNPVYNGIWRQYRQRHSNVDGWGSITTPYGTFDALRVRHLITETDSVFLELFGNPTWLPLPIPNTEIYEWWTTGQLEPILRIVVSDILGTQVVTGIEYRDNFLPQLASVEEKTISVNIYPNPVTELLTVEGAPIGSSFNIVGTDGKTVHSSVITSDIQSVPVERLSEGMYKIVFLHQGQLWSKQFIKK